MGMVRRRRKEGKGRNTFEREAFGFELLRYSQKTHIRDFLHSSSGEEGWGGGYLDEHNKSKVTRLSSQQVKSNDLSNNEPPTPDAIHAQ